MDMKLALALLASLAASQFVEVDDSDKRYFSLDGERFDFAGVNQREIGIKLQPDEIKDIMRQNKEWGFKVVRVWAFNEMDCGYSGCFASVGEDGKVHVNDEAMKRLDYVLHYAAENGIKVVMVPTNFEPSFGGMEWWVENVKKHKGTQLDFYQDEQVQEAYKSWLSQLINRVNSVNQVPYKSDPAIFAWNTANEPHTKDGQDYSGDIVAEWICEIAAYMKGLGIKQMVASGEEGYMTDGDQSGIMKDHSWVENGLKGVDFRQNAQCQNLDYPTVHMYPDNWKVPFDQFDEFIDEFLKERAQIAHENGKPLVVEEFGCCLAEEYKGNRGQTMELFTETFDRYNVGGDLVWQMFPNGSPLNKDPNYDFTPEMDQESANHLMNRKD